MLHCPVLHHHPASPCHLSLAIVFATCVSTCGRCCACGRACAARKLLQQQSGEHAFSLSLIASLRPNQGVATCRSRTCFRASLRPAKSSIHRISVTGMSVITLILSGHMLTFMSGSSCSLGSNSTRWTPSTSSEELGSGARVATCNCLASFAVRRLSVVAHWRLLYSHRADAFRRRAFGRASQQCGKRSGPRSQTCGAPSMPVCNREHDAAA